MEFVAIISATIGAAAGVGGAVLMRRTGFESNLINRLGMVEKRLDESEKREKDAERRESECRDSYRECLDNVRMLEEKITALRNPPTNGHAR